MPEFSIRLVAIPGGLAAHTAPCDCDEVTRDRSRAVVAQSVSEALSIRYAMGPVGVTAPDHVVRRDCARNVPMHPIEPFSWEQRHEFYVKDAAYALWGFAVVTATSAAAAQKELDDSRTDIDGEPVPLWTPAPDLTRELLLLAYEAKAYARVVAGIPEEGADDDACARLVMQADRVIRDELEVVGDVSTGYADTMNRAWAAIERQGAARTVRSLRSVLAKVHAHRTLRDADQ